MAEGEEVNVERVAKEGLMAESDLDDREEEEEEKEEEEDESEEVGEPTNELTGNG